MRRRENDSIQCITSCREQDGPNNQTASGIRGFRSGDSTEWRTTLSRSGRYSQLKSESGERLLGGGITGSRPPSHGQAKNPRARDPRLQKKIQVLAAIAGVILFVSTAFVLGNIGGHSIATIDTFSYSYGVTKSITISNAWGIAFYRNYYDTFGGGAPTNWTNGVLDALHFIKKDDSESYYLRDQLIAFDCMGMDPPASFTEATLKIPLEWFSSWAINGPRGEDTGHWEVRNFTISVYEILKPWKNWTSKYQSDGVTWAMLRDTPSMTDRTPIATMDGITKEEYGFGTSTHGNISLDITEAINDWKNGTWNPRNGLLISIIAPWETTDHSWFALSGLLSLGITVHFAMKETSLEISTNEPIPEFSSIALVIVGMILMVCVRRRRNE